MIGCMKVLSESAVHRVFSPLLVMAITLFAGVAIVLPDLAWHDRQRVVQVFLLLLTAAFACATLWRPMVWGSLARLQKSSRTALGVGFALGGVSAALSAYPGFAWLEWATLLLLLGMALVIAEQAKCWRVDFDIWAMRLLFLMAVVISLKIMMWYVLTIVGGEPLDTAGLFKSSFSNRRVFGQVASLVIPLLAYPLLNTDMPRVQRWGLFALLALWWMLLIMSGSRGSWVALVAAAVVLAAVAWRASSGWIRVQLCALGAGVLLYVVLFVGVPVWLGLDVTLENRLSQLTELNGRAELWAIAWTQIQAHPWLGVGPMHLAAIRNDIAAHPHNAILQLAAEWGVPAALALIVPVAVGMLRLLAKLRQQDVSPNILLVCLTASLLAASVLSMVDGVIVMPYTQTWLVLVAGWAMGVYFRDAAAKPVGLESRMFRLVLPALSLFALAALLIGIFPEVLNRAEALRAHIDAGGYVLIPPRYWGLGWIP